MPSRSSFEAGVNNGKQPIVGSPAATFLAPFEPLLRLGVQRYLQFLICQASSDFFSLFKSLFSSRAAKLRRFS
ncbi:hypothetical protein IC235_12475 [Hymenobacter sp. BT664]|uniref:Uncharacterized protein n=1 Tax=Hymenobacter montanus TaxID=2771359 RepID=A0A927GJN7_9BACT|nr:hypothetical protein [Hymenobacter montanus]